MKKIIFSILIVILVLGLVACDNDENKDLIDETVTANIYGQVIYPEMISIMNTDNNMIGHARVILDGKYSTITDYEGNFAFYNVSPGQHTIKVEDEVFKSKEYKVTVNKGMDLTGIKLEAEFEFVQIISIYNGDRKDYDMLLFVANMDPRLASGEIYYEINYQNEKEQGILEVYDLISYGVSYDVTDIFELEKEYHLFVRLLDKDKNVIKEFTKEVKFEKLDLYTPENNGEVTGTPKFTWEELDGIVEYEIDLLYYDEYGYYSRVYLDNYEKLLKSEYTLQLETGEELIDGQEYIWQVEASRYSETGALISVTESELRYFIYKEN